MKIHLQQLEATSGFACVSCGERVHMCEQYIHATRSDDTRIRGQRYCLDCERIARLNNNVCDDDDDDGERSLRMREAYAAYQTQGCTSEFWDDLNGGYIH